MIQMNISEMEKQEPNARLLGPKANIEEIAQQITLLEFDLMRSIRPREFLNLGSNPLRLQSPHIVQYHTHFKNVC